MLGEVPASDNLVLAQHYISKDFPFDLAVFMSEDGTSPTIHIATHRANDNDESFHYMGSPTLCVMVNDNTIMDT